MKCPMMVSLGVYVLGAADSGERRRLEAHLPSCAACQEELRRLAPLPGLLAGIPARMREPGRASGPHRAARSRWAAAAAACAAAVTGGIVFGSTGGGQHATAQTFTGANAATHVSATAILTATSWGTSIQLHLRGLPDNVECRLIVLSRSGRSEVSGVWDDWQHGPVSIPASASWLPSDIASLQVTTATKDLVTISVGEQHARDGQASAP
ncbi:MAG TPA: zf-HC2 domain-containing protein [Trebonia sp.]